jgi:ABC-2 type transport system permease protein
MKLINGNAIYVLWLREVKKFFRVKSRLIGTLATPLFFLIFLGFGLNAMSLPGIPEGVKYISFLVPGIIGMGLLFSSVFSGVTVIMDRQFGFLKEIMVAPVSRVSIVLGRIAGGATVSMIQGLMLILITFFVGFEAISPLSILLAIVFMVLISITFIGVGLIFASRMKDTQGFQLIVNFVIFPLFFLSGSLYPLNNLPSVIRYLSYADPLTYGIDGLRAVLIGFSVFNPWLDFVVLLGFSVVMVLFASYLFEKSRIV